MESGERMPTMESLCVEFDCAIDTMRSVFVTLTSEGLIYSSPGLGYFRDGDGGAAGKPAYAIVGAEMIRRWTRWPAGRQIPSELTLKTEFDCARKTVRQALGMAVEAGVVRRGGDNRLYVSPRA